MWAAGRGGLAAFRGDKWERIASPSELKDAAVYSVYEDRGGRLWIGTSEGVFSSGPHGFELRFPQSTFVQDFAQDRSGAMWVTDTRETIARLETGEGPIHAAGAPVPQAGWGIAADRRGNLWIAGLGGGLLRLNDQTTSFPTLERFAYSRRPRDRRERSSRIATATCGWGCVRAAYCGCPRTGSARTSGSMA